MKKSRRLATDLLGTTGVTMATTFAAMATVAILARLLDREEFLSYTLALRYFSLAIVMLGLGAGFSFIGRDDCEQEHKHKHKEALLLQILLISISLGFLLWIPISLWLSATSDIWPTWTPLGYLWIVAHTAFILSGPVSRAHGGVDSYIRLALGCRTMPYIAGIGLVVLTGEFMGLFVGFGMFSIFWLWRFWRHIRISFSYPIDWQTATSLLRFSTTRWLDDVVRTLFPVALILATSFFLGAEEAAVVALVYLVARVLESMLQPLVIALMMRGRITKFSLPLDLGRIAVFSLLLGSFLWFFRPLLEQFFVIFLGSEYSDITGLAWLMLMSASPIISLNYLRACYDNSFSHSPIFFINLLFIVILVCAVMWSRNVHDIVLCAVLAHSGRLLCYSCTLLILLGKHNGRIEQP